MKAKSHKSKHHASSTNSLLHGVVILAVLLGFSAVIFLAMDSSLFKMKQINVEPLSEGYPVSVERVLDLADVPMGRLNLFAMNLKPIETRLMKNPWVKGVVLSKQLPNTLVLKVIERKPISLLNELNGSVLYIEEDGATFEDRSMVYGKELPMISGFAANDPENLKKINHFIQAWFMQGSIPNLKVSSVSYDYKNGLRAMVIFPLKNKQNMRAMLELGQNIEEAEQIPQAKFKKVLDYLFEKSTPASKIWLGDGKKIVVKVSRGS